VRTTTVIGRGATPDRDGLDASLELSAQPSRYAQRMTEDTWSTRAVPLLQRILELEQQEDRGRTYMAGELVDGLEMTPNEAAAEVERLHDARYIGGRLIKAMRGSGEPQWAAYAGPCLRERGLRVVGAWPNGDPTDALLRLLEAREERAATSEESSKWRNLRDAVGSIGTQLTTEVLVALIKSQAGL
jgi:hypothetical protein